MKKLAMTSLIILVALTAAVPAKADRRGGFSSRISSLRSQGLQQSNRSNQQSAPKLRSTNTLGKSPKSGLKLGSPPQAVRSRSSSLKVGGGQGPGGFSKSLSNRAAKLKLPTKPSGNSPFKPNQLAGQAKIQFPSQRRSSNGNLTNKLTGNKNFLNQLKSKGSASPRNLNSPLNGSVASKLPGVKFPKPGTLLPGNIIKPKPGGNGFTPLPGIVKPFPGNVLKPLPFPPGPGVVRPQPPICYPKPKWCHRPRYCHWWWDLCPQIRFCPPAQCVPYTCTYVVAPITIDNGVVVEDARWWLGLKGMELPNTGLGVESVDEGSPAAQAGLAPGMVITKCNGIDIVNSEAMAQAIQQSGGVLNLTVLEKVGGASAEVTIEMVRLTTASF